MRNFVTDRNKITASEGQNSLQKTKIRAHCDKLKCDVRVQNSKWEENYVRT